MRVVKQGQLHEDFSWAVECKVCASELAVEPADVERYQYDDHRDPRDHADYLRCECPVCGASCFVAHWHDVPEVVRRRQLKGVRRA